jgi:hypothetical protein
MKFGKYPKKNDYRTLKLNKYVLPNLPTPAVSFSVLPEIYSKLGVNDPTQLFPMDGNDSLGNCTIAARSHAITVFQGMINRKNIPSAQDTIALYNRLSGGKDTGLAELDVLNDWRKETDDPILAYAEIDPKNHDHVKQAMMLYGAVYIGFQVQENCIQEFNAHQPWTPGPLLSEGHAVLTVAYDASGVTVLTWGNTQLGTWAWWDACVDEAYAILPIEAGDPTYAPGLDIVTLLEDLTAIS